MAVWEALLEIVILLGAGAVLGGLAERLRQSAILGYLVAGGLLGPHALNLVESRDEVLAISELGVALLLFAIGLEFSWQRLRAMGRFALGAGAIQITVTVVVAAGLAAWTGLGATAALVFGAICALSSTACVLRVLQSRGELESVHGERALGILLVQDMAVVPLVLVVGVLVQGGSLSGIMIDVARTLAIGLALVVGLFVVFHLLVPQLLHTRAVHSNREIPLLVAVVSALSSGVAAHEAGVSPAIGTFVAGMVLAESPFAVQVRADVSGLKSLLLTLFFTAIGMLTNPGWIAGNALLVGGVVLAVVVGKTLIAWGVLAVLGARHQTALAAGLCLAQIGEFSFVLAGMARGHLLDERWFPLVVSVTVFTMFLSPYLVTYAPLVAARLVGRGVDVGAVTGGPHEGGPLGIVVGFGPAGRAAAAHIAEGGLEIVVVDQNPELARDARRLGYAAVTGDACHGDVLDHAGLARARLVMVTVPSTDTALRVTRQVRLSAPEALVLVRGRFHRALPALQAAGAHVVVDEEHEVGRRIAVEFAALAGERKDGPPTGG